MLLSDLDKGFFAEARQKNLTPMSYLTALVSPEEPEVEKVAARVLRRFRQADDDSFRSLALRQYAYDVTGLEKMLADRQIRTRGPGSDTVEKFFVSSNNSVLFPVYLATNIIQGILASSLVPMLAASEVRINSHVAQKVTTTDTAVTRTLRWVGEGADIPKTKITTAEGSITLYKYARMLEASYESVRLMHLDIFSLMLMRMGMQIGIDQSDDLLETLVSGDGTASSALTATNTAVAGVMGYDDIVKFRLAFPLGYSLDHAVVGDTNLRAILNMAEFKDPQANAATFQRTGQLTDYLGASWHRWTSSGSAGFTGVRILGVDGRGAVALYREGDLLEEYGQLIDKQLYQRTMTEWVGFMKLDTSASQALNNN